MNATLKAGLILLVVFALGAMAGIATMRVTHEPQRRGPSDDPFRKDPEVVDRIERRLVDRYDFTEEQRVAVRRILMDSQKKYDDFFQETRPIFDKIRRNQQMAIRELMSQEQLEAFDKWIEERRRRGPGGGHNGDRRRPDRPPPPGSGHRPAKDDTSDK